MIRYLRVRNPETRGIVSLPQIGTNYMVGGLKIKSEAVSIAPGDFLATMTVDDLSKTLIVDDLRLVEDC